MFEEYPTPPMQRVLIWDKAHEEEAKAYAIEMGGGAADIPVVLIKSHDWLNKNVRVGDVIVHSWH